MAKSSSSRETAVDPADTSEKTVKDADLNSKDHDAALEAGDQPRPTRRRWTPFDPLNFRSPVEPPPPSMDASPIIPLAPASFLNKLFFVWLSPLLVLGYQRTLVAEDLWKLDEKREAAYLSAKFLEHFERRREEIERWNDALNKGEWKPSAGRKLWWSFRSRWLRWGRRDGRREVGMAMALSDTFGWDFWSAAAFKIVGDLAQVTSPLIIREIIRYVTQAANARDGIPGWTAPSYGTGVGLAIGAFLLQFIFAICLAQTLSRAAQCGVLARAALISAVYRRAMILSGKSRVHLTNSKLVNHISTDISRIDFASSFFHFSYTSIIQLIEVIIILLCTIGVTALTGVAFALLLLPFQVYAMRRLFIGRQKSMVFTDARIKAISEALSGIRVIKLFGWEVPYLEKLHEYRRRELRGVAQLLTIRAGNQAVALSLPVLASVLVFVTYGATGHAQNAATIWTAFSLLNLLRMPLMLLPTALSTMTDAKQALNRLLVVFTSETLEDAFEIAPSAKFAVDVSSASFTWEQSLPETSTKAKKGKNAPTPAQPKHEELPPPSRIEDVTLQIPRGELWILCGAIGSGKSSLLHGLVGEMRKTKGEVSFGGTVSYCAQTPWIQNDTVRANILFGRPWEEKRYWDCVRASCLMADLDMLPSGDMTVIGEKGISLSGGQRQRVSICRTLYFNADIALLDDVLSALDAHVGREVMENVVLGAMASKTRILATHAVHFMSHANRILYMEDGRIVEQGTHETLVAAGGAFSRLAAEYGRPRDEDAAEALAAKRAEVEEKEGDHAGDDQKKQSGMMQVEERATGAISNEVYKAYFLAAKGWLNGPLLLAMLVLMQGALGVSQFELTWWQRDRWNQSDSFYMGLYAALGVSSACFTFLAGVMTVRVGTTAARNMHRDAMEAVMRAPMSMFDTTPMGRILNRFTKDIDNLDNRLNDSARMALVTFAGIIGSFVVVSIVQHYFLIAIAAIAAYYMYISRFYSKSAREIKRIDNILRSGLYAHFSESLAGLATIRAFGETERFVETNDRFIDGEDRAYLLTVINQRWLGIRVDIMGALLTLLVALLAACDRYAFTPSSIGLVLASLLAISTAFSVQIRQTAEVDNNFGSVERLHHYAAHLEQEAPREVSEHQPPPDWPAKGGIDFHDIVMRYRPELPAVLTGLSLSIRPSEKVGIVGRTGAGKSSIAAALFRICELSSGNIVIDGVDISQLGLHDLRKRLAIIPQDALLFNGTLRTNLDPFGEYEDATLWSALKRSWLVERDVTTVASEDPAHSKRFTLDTKVEDEGLNMSVGERSLVSLARALVKDSRIVLLDEATASVDMDTDSRIQQTIAIEFKDKTLLCIAHRLNTIIGYDRVLVMDKGKVSAFDTPEALYDAGGIFHGLCVESGITVEDIRRSRRIALGEQA